MYFGIFFLISSCDDENGEFIEFPNPCQPKCKNPFPDFVSQLFSNSECDSLKRSVFHNKK